MLADRISGWLEPLAAEWISKQAPQQKLIVELGTWMGRSCSVWCEFSTPDAKVYSVEHFRGSPDTNGEKGPCGQAFTDRGGVMIEALTNLRQFINSGKLDFLITDSVRAAACWPILVGQPIDCCWIDASHYTDDVLADIRAWRPLMRPGGIMCGHDGFWPTVQAALNVELPGWVFVETMRDEMGAIHAGIWWWKVPA